MRIFLVMLLALGVLTAAARLRAPEYDEAYSLFLTAGDARPAWPAGVFQAGDVRGLYAGRAGLGQIAANLRRGDVHPPLYFWALEYWRRVVGPSWFGARLFSVLCSLGALAALGWLAALAELPVVPAMLLALFSYGFVYTGIVARGFALAQLLNILGVALTLAATRKRQRAGLAGGIALGAAGFANYLASFTGVAVLVWLLGKKRLHCLLPAACGFLLFIPADLYFFLAQKSSRAGQFNAFSWPHAVAALLKDSGAAMFGGLPVYAGRFGPAVAGALGLLLCICLAIAWRARSPRRTLLLLLVAAPPTGLLALGLVFNNMPIEIRYLAFSLPFLALLLALLPRLPLLLLLAAQAAGVAGLCFAPATMQPQTRAARQAAAFPGALVLLPFGNDGVGIPGPFIAVAPKAMRIRLIKPGAPVDLAGETRIILADIEIDGASKIAAQATLSRLRADPCLQAQPGTALIDIFKRVCTDSLHKH